MDLRELKVIESNFKRHPWELARLKVIENIILKHIPNINSLEDFSILDMGCGDTFFMETLSLKFSKAKLIGVDIAFESTFKQELQSKYRNTNISICTSIEEVKNLTSKPLKLVLLLDVIEHIEKDIEFLDWLINFELIDENTLFIISVPAFQILFCEHDIFLGHFRRYTNKLLLNNIEKAGLKKVELGYFFWILIIPRCIQKMVELIFKNKEKKTGLSTWNGGKLITTSFTQILYLDFIVSKFFNKIGIKIPGLSNYIVCKKNNYGK